MKKLVLATITSLGTSLGGIALLGAFSACNDFNLPTSFTGDDGSTADVTDSDSGDDSGSDPDNTVCDPFGDDGGASAQNGLVSKLFYQQPGDPKYGLAKNFNDIVENGHDTGVNIYMNKLYVPTRAFDLGFVNENGELLTTENGNTLYEYFAIKAQTNLQLGPNDSPGLYQLATLADDGIVVETKPFGADDSVPWTTQIAADKITSSRFSCAQTFVDMQPGVPLQTQIKYWQGPKFHIAAILLWRKVTPNMLASQDPYFDDVCGYADNSLWFDWTKTPSLATWAWTDYVLNKNNQPNWSVLGAENYLLSAGNSNPCVDDGDDGDNGGGGDDDPVIGGV